MTQTTKSIVKIKSSGHYLFGSMPEDTAKGPTLDFLSVFRLTTPNEVPISGFFTALEGTMSNPILESHRVAIEVFSWINELLEAKVGMYGSLIKKENSLLTTLPNN